MSGPSVKRQVIDLLSDERSKVLAAVRVDRWPGDAQVTVTVTVPHDALTALDVCLP